MRILGGLRFSQIILLKIVSLFGYSTIAPKSFFMGFTPVVPVYVMIAVSRIGQKAEFAWTADVCSTLSLIDLLSRFLLLLRSPPPSFHLSLHHIIVNHIHALMWVLDPSKFLLVFLANRHKEFPRSRISLRSWTNGHQCEFLFRVHPSLNTNNIGKCTVTIDQLSSIYFLNWMSTIHLEHIFHRF